MSSVGSGALSVKQAIIIAAIFEFAGAFLAGGHVTKTIRKGIIDPTTVIAQPACNCQPDRRSNQC
jgi:PiT family inorganic phosphate transporter